LEVNGTSDPSAKLVILFKCPVHARPWGKALTTLASVTGNVDERTSSRYKFRMKLRPSRVVYQSATLAEPTCVLRGGTFAMTTARLLLVSLPVVACGQDQDDSGAVPMMPSTPTVPSISTGSVPISPPNGASTLDMGQTSAEPTAGGTGVDVSPGEVSPSVGPAATEDTSGAS